MNPSRGAGQRPTPAVTQELADQDLVDAFALASRALVGLAARSLAGIGEEVTLAQYRALVVLSSRGPQRASDLAAGLGVNPSTASRMVDRLVRKHLVRRERGRGDRRTLRVHLTAGGREVVTTVTERRTGEIALVLERMPEEGRALLAHALQSFAVAAGEPPAAGSALGWDE